MTTFTNIQTIIRKARRFVGIPVRFSPLSEYTNAAVPAEYTNEARITKGYVMSHEPSVF